VDKIHLAQDRDLELASVSKAMNIQFPRKLGIS
jgi:hypothetical protein